jgi:4-diphosphocytidyl-2-C-methyl-D-erythritol kinase
VTRISIRAFAKINLSLRVGPKRHDGFHDVRTILQGIELSDRVVCERRRGPFEIACATPGIPADRTNLVWKAAQRLWEADGRDGQVRDARVLLEKNIPASAGLGGGSSDAAAALLALRRIWRLDVSDDVLRAIGAKLGSDVPYFFVGGTALALGRGEEVYALEDLPRLSVVLIFPPFGVATATAYEWLDDARGRRSNAGIAVDEAAPSPFPRLSPRPFVNDLEAPVIERHPLVGTLKARLVKMGATLAAMSGSGSTVFGVFSSASKAAAAAKQLSRGGARVCLTRFQPRPGA